MKIKEVTRLVGRARESDNDKRVGKESLVGKGEGWTMFHESVTSSLPKTTYSKGVVGI